MTVTGGLTFTHLSAGLFHTCGITSSSTSKCWGYDTYGQIGDGNDGQADEHAPVAVAGGHAFTIMSAGYYQTCALTSTGAAWCWGRDSSGQVGDGNDGQADKYAPVAVAGSHTFAALSGGLFHTCGIDTAGTAWCWGFDGNGQLGNGADSATKFTPVQVAGTGGFTTLTAGQYHTCGINSAGAAWCWGADADGQVGDGDDDQGNEYAPVAVAGGHTFATTY